MEIYGQIIKNIGFWFFLNERVNLHSWHIIYKTVSVDKTKEM